MITEKQVVNNKVRLPKEIYPTKYNLNIHIDPFELTYIVDEDIELEIKQKLENHICLHSLQEDYQIQQIDVVFNKTNYACKFYSSGDLLEIIKKFESRHSNSYEEVIKNFDSQKKEVFDFIYSKDLNQNIHPIEETVYIQLNEDIERDNLSKINLRIVVKGNVRTQINTGFYLSFDGDTKKLKKESNFKELWKSNFEELYPQAYFGVQSEPVESRSIFPCFDEPCFKSVFSVNVSVDHKYVTKHLTIVSNGPLIQQKGDDKIVVYSFHNTPPMSIYLLTWNMGHFEYIEETIQGKSLRVYTPVGRLHSGTYAMELAKGAFVFFIEYFGIQFNIRWKYYTLFLFPKVNIELWKDGDVLHLLLMYS